MRLTLYALDIMLIHERLILFYERLRAAPACVSHDQAFLLVCETLTTIEDEFSGIANQVANHATDGRMYPPQSDNRFEVEGRPDLTRYRSKGHQTYISESGAILIVRTNGSVELSKCDANDEEIIL